MSFVDYQHKIQQQIDSTNALPTSELKYYLLLLLNSLKDHESELSKDVLEKLSDFILKLTGVLTIDLNNLFFIYKYTVDELFRDLVVSYQQLINSSKTDRLALKIGYGLLHLGGAVSAFFMGLLGGLIGGCAGFFRSIYNHNNPLTECGVGVVTGYMLGATIGFRLPKKAFKNELTRQLKFCLDGIHDAMDSIELPSQNHWQTVLQETKDEIRKTYFSDNQLAFQTYLNDETIQYEICTLPAQFISESLEGYLGHHAFIKLPIDNEKNEPLIIEFSTSKSNLSRPLSNTEKRTTSGEKIIEMLAFHRLLQETHECTPGFIIEKMKPGVLDCLSYVDKILTGIGEEATKLRRFNGRENWVGRKVVGFFIEKLSPFKKDILREDPMEDVADDRASPTSFNL